MFMSLQHSNKLLYLTLVYVYIVLIFLTQSSVPCFYNCCIQFHNAGMLSWRTSVYDGGMGDTWNWEWGQLVKLLVATRHFRVSVFQGYRCIWLLIHQLLWTCDYYLRDNSSPCMIGLVWLVTVLYMGITYIVILAHGHFSNGLDLVLDFIRYEFKCLLCRLLVV